MGNLCTKEPEVEKNDTNMMSKRPMEEPIFDSKMPRAKEDANKPLSTIETGWFGSMFSFFSLTSNQRDMIESEGLYDYSLSMPDLMGTEKLPITDLTTDRFFYRGQVKDNKPHGIGQLQVKLNLDFYICAFKDGVAVGIGQIIYGNGDQFFGKLERRVSE